MNIAAHYDALLARLRHGILTDRVDEVVRLTQGGEPVRTNYVVVGIDLPGLDDARYTAGQTLGSTGLFRFDVRSVAVDQRGAVVYAQAVRERLIGHALEVSGRVCDPIRLVGAVEEGRVEHDRTVGLFYVDETFEFVSRGA